MNLNIQNNIDNLYKKFENYIKIHPNLDTNTIDKNLMNYSYIYGKFVENLYLNFNIYYNPAENIPKINTVIISLYPILECYKSNKKCNNLSIITPFYHIKHNLSNSVIDYILNDNVLMFRFLENSIKCINLFEFAIQNNSRKIVHNMIVNESDVITQIDNFNILFKYNQHTYMYNIISSFKFHDFIIYQINKQTEYENIRKLFINNTINNYDNQLVEYYRVVHIKYNIPILKLDADLGITNIKNAVNSYRPNVLKYLIHMGINFKSNDYYGIRKIIKKFDQHLFEYAYTSINFNQEDILILITFAKKYNKLNIVSYIEKHMKYE